MKVREHPLLSCQFSHWVALEESLNQTVYEELQTPMQVCRKFSLRIIRALLLLCSSEYWLWVWPSRCHLTSCQTRKTIPRSDLKYVHASSELPWNTTVTVWVRPPVMIVIDTITRNCGLTGWRWSWPSGTPSLERDNLWLLQTSQCPHLSSLRPWSKQSLKTVYAVGPTYFHTLFVNLMF